MRNGTLYSHYEAFEYLYNVGHFTMPEIESMYFDELEHHLKKYNLYWKEEINSWEYKK